jgi:solute carrier family 10 (sodium/bile acid cotransporter), member 7
MRAMLSPLRAHAFIVLMIGAVLLGSFTPEWGARGGYLHSEWLTRLGIFIIFLVQGVGLSTEALRYGIRQWRLHLFTQAWIGLGIPLLVLVARLLGGQMGDPSLWAGLWFLAVLPTTVSSAVAFIGQAEGNVAAGVFNTVCSNLLAILLVPAWVLLYESASGASLPPVWPILRQLFLLLLLPFVLGHALHRGWPILPRLLKPVARPLTQGIILFMLYAAFANSAAEAVWERVGVAHTVQAALGAAVLLAASSTAILVTARRAFSSVPDRIAAFFCGSQKSLATGIPFALAIYGGTAAGADRVGLIILPLLFYHPLQLLLGAVLARAPASFFGPVEPAAKRREGDLRG